MEEKAYIYIVLIKALTKLGKFSRRINPYEYTHISVCLDDKLEDFITFSRKRHYSPFDSGFMHEKIEHYAFGDKKEVKVKVFAIPVNINNKYKIEEYIKKIENDKEYIFNLYSMITMPFFHGVEIYKAHNCMSFVSKIIELSNSVTLEKKYYQYSIEDIDKLLDKYLCKEGYLQKRKEDEKYMQKVGLILNTKLFISLNIKLIFRIIMKRNKK